MDAYSDYNQIKIDPVGAAKITFMSNRDYYYYNDMSFRLKKHMCHLSETHGHDVLKTDRT